MLIDFFTKQWWLSIILGDLLILSDMGLTVFGAKLHKRYAAQYITYQNGYELNPEFEKDIAQYRWPIRKIISQLIVISLGFFLLGFLGENVKFARWFFEFMIGGLFLSRIDIDLVHLQNIWFFIDIKKPGRLDGHLEYSYWISQRRTAGRLFSQVILFIVSALATMRPFFWGGVVICLIVGLKSLQLANRKFPPPLPKM